MTRAYTEDFAGWAEDTAKAIEEGRFEEIDRAALADEVASLGRQERREAESRMAVILMHMLKAKYQPEKLSASWQATIRTQRRDLAKVLKDSPSLRPQVAALLLEAYEDARFEATNETGLDIATFPETCEWTVEEVLGGEAK